MKIINKGLVRLPALLALVAIVVIVITLVIDLFQNYSDYAFKSFEIIHDCYEDNLNTILMDDYTPYENYCKNCGQDMQNNPILKVRRNGLSCVDCGESRDYIGYCIDCGGAIRGNKAIYLSDTVFRDYNGVVLYRVKAFLLIALPIIGFPLCLSFSILELDDKIN